MIHTITRRRTQAGFSVLEVVIASAIGLMTISAVLMVSLTDQSIGSDSEVGREALAIAQKMVEKNLADSRQNYTGLIPSSQSECVGALCYAKNVTIPTALMSQCKKTVVSTVAWTGSQSRSQQVSLSTNVVNVPELLALGGSCDTVPPTGGWNPPQTCVSDNFNPGKPTGLDVMNKLVYMTGDKPPYLYIADTSAIDATCSSPPSPPNLFVNIGFDAGNKLNDVRVGRIGSSVYAFVVSDSNTNQFRIYNVTNKNSVTEVARRSLSGVNPAGSYPQGWRVFYYDSRAYVVSRETAGPEMHVFDVTNPSSPVELGSGYELGRTVESMVVTRRNISGTDRVYAYLATDKLSAEVTVLDVTNPSAILEISAPDQDLPGGQDGASVYLLGDLLYVGRLSVPGGSDLYVFDASHPNTGLTKIAEADIGTSVIGIAVTGQFAFLSTTKSNNEVQVWRSDPANLTSINTSFNFPNLIDNGIRYSNNFVYVASQGNDALRVLYSSP